MIENHTSQGSYSRKIIIALGFTTMISFFLYLPALWSFFTKSDAIAVNFYSYGDAFENATFYEFTKETGITVNVKVFESNEELLAQFEINGGSSYDVASPSDYMVEILHEKGLIQEINTSLLTNYTQLDNRLLNRNFDPGNKYSVPYEWSYFGLGYDKRFFGETLPVESWAMIFSDKLPGMERNFKICIPDDPRELILLSSLYLYKEARNFTPKRLVEIKNLLIKQETWTESYIQESLNKYFIASGIVPLIVIQSGSMAELIKTNDNFGFIVPKEGTLISVENLVIPKGSKKSVAAHKLIDYILSEKVLLDAYGKCGYFPSNKHALHEIEKQAPPEKSLIPKDSLFSQLHPFHNEIGLRYISDLWLKVQTAQ